MKLFLILIIFFNKIGKIIISYTLANNTIGAWCISLVGSRSWKLVIGSVGFFYVDWYFGMWKDCMATVAIITVCTIMCIAVGIPLGVFMARSKDFKGQCFLS
ncbi:MAG: hypothetical protein CM1200mP13_10000 [Candidatus Pelagibacterales bacterium]|nr:MAG: hypothetical protein CM1200mP13_10000 [Pelagibacterales bacterium]